MQAHALGTCLKEALAARRPQKLPERPRWRPTPPTAAKTPRLDPPLQAGYVEDGRLHASIAGRQPENAFEQRPRTPPRHSNGQSGSQTDGTPGCRLARMVQIPMPSATPTMITQSITFRTPAAVSGRAVSFAILGTLSCSLSSGSLLPTDPNRESRCQQKAERSMQLCSDERSSLIRQA